MCARNGRALHFIQFVIVFNINWMMMMLDGQVSLTKFQFLYRDANEKKETKTEKYQRQTYTRNICNECHSGAYPNL